MKTFYQEAAFKQLCLDAGTPFAGKCLTAFEVDGISGLERVRDSFSPSAYRDVGTFEVDYLIWTYLSKIKFPVYPEKEMVDKCISDFLKSERRNRITNERLANSPLRGLAGELLFEVRRRIKSVLGPFERRNLLWREHCDWGPGATSSLRAVDSTLDKKILEDRISITPGALPYFKGIVSNDYHWFYARNGILPEGPFNWTDDNFEIVVAERFSTAPKKWNKLRTISIQPTGNLYCQKGAGAYIRRQLKFVAGIDLDSQSRNQHLAEMCYALNWATIDLQDASNSMTRELIHLVCEPDWAEFFDDLRCPFARLPDGSLKFLELHSAMGNGYTFELESLIFWAISQATVDHSGVASSVAVFGDDIIVPQSCAAAVIEVLSEYGFSTNMEKTFTSGKFFESCGEHFFEGCNVTPIYEKEWTFRLENIVRSFNRLHRWCQRTGRIQQFRRTLNHLELCAFSAHAQEVERIMRHRRKQLRKSRRTSRRNPSKPFVSKGLPYLPEWSDLDAGLLTDDESLWSRFTKISGAVVKYSGVWVSRPITFPGDQAAMLSCEIRKISPRRRSLVDLLMDGAHNVPDAASFGLITPRDKAKWGFGSVKSLLIGR